MRLVIGLVIMCFYSTYEELKLAISPSSFLEESCFYSTYEELKQEMSKIGYKSEESFYSTYEELKLTKPYSLAIASLSFLQYLWGIETIKAFNTDDSFVLVFTVPMRNWNRNERANNAIQLYSFYSTYEELKLK